MLHTVTAPVTYGYRCVVSLWAEVEGRVAPVAAELAALGTELCGTDWCGCRAALASQP